MNTPEVPTVTPDNMPRLGKIKALLHIGEFTFSILTLCTVAAVVATEIRFYGGSQAAPNWTLVVTILTWWIPVVLFYFPWAYDRHDKFRRIGKFCLKPRTNLIFSIFGTVLWVAAGIAMTVHASNPTHCTLDGGRAESDNGYASAWPVQCNCAKAAAVFSWLDCLFWLATLVCSIIIYWNEKQFTLQNRKQLEESKLEQTPAAVTSDKETAAILSSDNLQQQDKCEISPSEPFHHQHQGMAAILPSNCTLPFHQPSPMDMYSMPMSAATLPPQFQTPYSSLSAHHHHHPYQ